MSRDEWVAVWDECHKRHIGGGVHEPYLGDLMCKLACIYLAERGHKGTHLFDTEPWDDHENPLVLLVDGASHTMTCFRLNDVQGENGQAC